MSFLCVSCHPDLVSERRDYSDYLIAKVEEYKAKFGRLPESVSELGVQESETELAFYKREGDSGYIVWYGTMIGESAIYTSGSGKWVGR